MLLVYFRARSPVTFKPCAAFTCCGKCWDEMVQTKIKKAAQTLRTKPLLLVTNALLFNLEKVAAKTCDGGSGSSRKYELKRSA